MTDCITYIRSNRGWLVLNLTGAAMLAFLFLGAFWRFIEVTKPENPVMDGYSFVQTTGAHLWMVARYKTTRISPCTRIGAYLLSRNVGGATNPDYIPLGNALNGAGLGSVPGQFNVWLDVSGVPSGPWWYVYRTENTCPPLGLVHWPDHGERVRIDIP